MSEQHFAAFLEAVKSDQLLQEKLKGASDADAVAPAVRKVVALIFDHGGGDVEVTNAALQRGRQG